MKLIWLSLLCVGLADGLALKDHSDILTDSVTDSVADITSNDTSDSTMDAEVDASMNVCELPTALPVAFALSDDEIIDKDHSVAQRAGVPDEEAKRAALQEALVDYRQKKQQYQLATSKLMGAMEALLSVPVADLPKLEEVASAKAAKDTLVVFYAPWCPHCQSFVLHDSEGNPTNAPLEKFHRDLQKDNSLKNVQLLRADVTKLGNEIPAPFDVQAIPTIYFVNREGEESKFDGNPQDLTELKGFVSGLLSD